MRESSYYLDTSIWIDIYDKRGYNGEVAKNLMKKIILEDSSIIYSDVIVYELDRLRFSNFEIEEMFRIPRKKQMRRINVTKKQVKEAKNISRRRSVPLRDSMHAIIARDCEAQLVSRDWDFEKLKDITRAKLPEELL